MFQHVVQVLGPCEIDLFAMRLNSQLPQYISWCPDPFAVAVDALDCLIGRCLRKVWTASLLFIAPVWPMQSWYPVLQELLVDLPLRCMPIHQDLLHDPFSRPHPLLIQGSLHYSTACHLESVRQKQQAQGISRKATNLISAGWSKGRN